MLGSKTLAGVLGALVLVGVAGILLLRDGAGRAARTPASAMAGAPAASAPAGARPVGVSPYGIWAARRQLQAAPGAGRASVPPSMQRTRRPISRTPPR